MAEPSRNIGITRYLSRRLLPLSVGIGLFIAIGAPVSYWLIEQSSLRRHAILYAQDLAEKFQAFALESPTLWKYQTYKFINITEGFHPTIDVSGFCVLDEKGEPITGYEFGGGKVIHKGALTFTEELRDTMGSSPIIFNNRRVGTVLVTVSDTNLIGSTAVLFIISTTIGTILALLAFRFPVRVVKGAEAEIGKLLATVQEREEKYRTVVENIPDITWTANQQGDSIYVSPNIENIIGYSLEEVLEGGGSFWFGRVHPDDLEQYAEGL